MAATAIGAAIARFSSAADAGQDVPFLAIRPASGFA
jgi:hypothetical protein